jgi:isopenicillin-N epimerase
MKDQFLLNPAITYLNFASFGACARPVFEEYQKYQLELETEPVQFVAVNSTHYLKASRKALGAYIHCHEDDVVFTPNPSYAINIITKSLKLNPGDEILTTNLEYGAMDKTWSHYCKQTGAKYVKQPINLPITSKEQILSDFWKGLTPKTKVIFLGQITSATALILPVKEICEIAKEKGLLTIIDGAHVPGHIPLNLQDMKADIYTGACHKWMMTPKGCSFLYVNKENQSWVDPLVVNWGYESAMPSGSQFQDYHELQGTRDISAFLTVQKAIEFMNLHQWEQKSANCRKLVRDNAARFCELLNAKPLAPVTEEFIGQMISIPIRTKEPEALQRLLFTEYNIEVPIMRHGENTYLRYSIQVFNSQQDLDILYKALENILETTGFIQLA